MTSRERVLSALNHKTPDRCPLDLGAGKSCKFTLIAYQKVLQHFGIQEEIRVQSKTAQTAFASDNVLERLESDVRAVFPAFIRNATSSILDGNSSFAKQWEDEDYYYLQDEWRAIHRMPKQGGLYYDMYGFPLAGAGEAEDAAYVWPEPAGIQRGVLEEAKRYRASGYPVILTENYANGFLQTGPKIYGHENWLMMLASEEKRALAILDKLLEKKMEYWDKILDVLDTSLDIVCEQDDLGAQRGPFISPEMFRRIIKPYYKILFPYIKRKSGAKLFMHSDGAIATMIPDLIEAGVDIINPVQLGAAGMEPAILKREFGRDIAFWGGSVNTRTLSIGTPQQVADEVKRNVEVFTKDGGFVFSSVHNIQANVPIENFVALWETFLKCRN